MTENTSTISRCEAAHCRFNSDHKCTAGQVELAMNADKVQCVTFAPQEGEQGERPTTQQ